MTTDSNDARPQRPALQPMDWLFALLLIAVAVANLLLVHPVPAAGYLIASLVFLPPVHALFKRRWRFTVHPIIRIVLGVVIVMFTLGVSDLGDLLD